MIILNDCVRQTLIIRDDRIKIINDFKRYETLGAKRQALLWSAPQNSVCFPWDDDDISLPHRMSQGVAAIGDKGYWNPRQSFYYPREGLCHTHKHGCTHNASCFKRDFFLSLGGYNINAHADDDQWADKKLGGTLNPLTAPNEWSYLYRWGVSDHVSSKCRKYPVLVDGVVDLKPYWAINYKELVDGYLIRNNLISVGNS